MNYTIFIPTLLLFSTIILVTLSGNDKGPFFVLFIAGVNAIGAFISLIALLLGKIPFRSFFIIVFPTLYVILIIVLAKYGILDPQIFLGIR